ncbi:uncharacterized protein LOC142905111 [Nelusetta ayraudi]|uniref:uncharacterized protein LOC142905111 n=1 Tax=Nelusetta ayraudi TaxID=303726 RepID=UPI003F72CDA4
MGKIFFGIIAVVASIVLAESLTCNKCNYGLAGFCMSNTEENCTTNTSVCASTKISFTSLTNVGFSTLGCSEPSGCNTTTNGTLLLAYQNKVECCSTDKCNTVQLSGAPSTRMTLTAALGVAVLATVWSSIIPQWSRKQSGYSPNADTNTSLGHCLISFFAPHSKSNSHLKVRMKRFMLVSAALVAVFATGDSLICRTCRVGIMGKCLFSGSKVCSQSEPNCHSSELALNHTRAMVIESGGCIASHLCNQTESGSVLTLSYTMTKTCCSTDFCNGATSVRLPLAAALSAALVAIWTTWSL